MKWIFLSALVLLSLGTLASARELYKHPHMTPWKDIDIECWQRAMEKDVNDQPCFHHACMNGGTICTGTYVCICMEGTYGECCSEVHDCPNAFCGHDKTARCKYDQFPELYTCFCTTYRNFFDIKEKRCREVCFKDNDCFNGGKCNWHGYFQFCDCLPGTDGDLCSEVVECKKKELCGADNKTTCSYDQTHMQAICNCLDTSKQFDYKEKMCKMPCKNDADCEVEHKCIGDEVLRFCECIPGKTVNFCSHVTDCNETDACGTGNDVTCEYDTIHLKGRCQCSNSSLQFDYRKKICKEPCQDGDCENGGKCTGHGDFKFCECLPGTAGDHCSEVTDCKEADFCGKGNDTICIYNSTRFEAMCQCLNSSKQFYYKEKVCKKTCEEGDCENGANCTLSEDFAFCECLPGTEGDVCSEVVECKEDNVCGTHNDSICTYESLLREAICQCSDPKKLFDYKEKICKSESKGSTFFALTGSLFAFVTIAFSSLFYLCRRKQKMGVALRFKKLKESVGEKYEQSVSLK